MTIDEFVPSIKSGIVDLGLLFGAGSSFEAGYPLVSGLTDSVINALNSSERTALDEGLSNSSVKYDADNNTPNIEEISDLILEHFTNGGDVRFRRLGERIRSLINECILSVTDPQMDSHISLFERLKNRSYDRPTTVWIFTTNYDLLFEDAAAIAGVRIINGFSGGIHRFFSEKELELVRGKKQSNRFIEDNCLTIKLIKLHGSISWYHNNGNLFETHPNQILNNDRCMVLPRKSKTVETLANPYDRLFTISSKIIGNQCRSLIASGFSFSDQHINSNLIIPKISSGDISFANFCMHEPQGLRSQRGRPNVTHICQDKIVHGGRETSKSSITWKFSEFVKLF